MIKIKNRPFSIVLVVASLVAWLTQFMREWQSIRVFDTSTLAMERHDVFMGAAWALWPYALLCGIAVFISLPKASRFFLLVTLIIVAWTDIDMTSADVSGGDMRGLGIVVEYFFQMCAVAVGVSLTLIARIVASLSKAETSGGVSR